MLVEDIQLAKNFWLHEMLVSESYPEIAARLQPTQLQIRNMFFVAQLILQPGRDYLCQLKKRDIKLHVSSGFRDDMLNELVGGVTLSIHKEGGAVDMYPDPVNLESLYKFYRTHLKHTLLQLIWYRRKRMIHAALPVPGYSHKVIEIRD